jgi:hypothetical protein
MKAHRSEYTSPPTVNLPLKDILDAQSKARPPGALELCLGDGFLLEHNVVCANIRSLARRFGYSYTTEDFCHYGSQKYASLEQILAQKRIPYFDNVSTLLALERNQPGMFQFKDVSSLTKNYLLHETAHCVADWLMKNRAIDFSSLDPERALFLKLNLGESFANTVDHFARNICGSDLELLFLDWNSYLVSPPLLRNTFTELLQLLGPRTVFRSLFLGYLFANFRYKELNDKGIQLVLGVFDEKLEVGSTAFEALSQVVNSAFDLNESFRVRTQSFYLKMLGVNTDCASLCDFNFVSTIARNPGLKSLINEFAAVSEPQPGVPTHQDGLTGRTSDSVFST